MGRSNINVWMKGRHGAAIHCFFGIGTWFPSTYGRSFILCGGTPWTSRPRYGEKGCCKHESSGRNQVNRHRGRSSHSCGMIETPESFPPGHCTICSAREIDLEMDREMWISSVQLS
ncbi:hypothetical protein SAY86_002005 [Trapa natans]|uniref:Uncharacterized protein n=1 Tax=Trapa natans TaxID=22666 RepID=A0AAN7LRC1_TRANT|nr:hypothetical protein SAY86_002005 [Trapa natans]